jgi:hypothetical protein
MNSSDSAKVRLQNLVDRKILHEEPASPVEVQGLLSSAADFLADARRKDNSEATRFNVAYEAAHAIALAAMRALDLRPAQGPGHRAIVFNVLDCTTAAKPEIHVPLSKAHDKRNKLTYDGLTTFSSAELDELIERTEMLEKLVRQDIAARRPELLRRK